MKDEKQLCDTRGSRTKELLQELEGNDCIEYLVLSGNEIDGEGLQDVLEILRRHPTILHLDIGENPFGVDGGVRIAEALKSNKTLRFFDLEGCHIGAGVVDVAQALANHETLAYINLSNCAITMNELNALKIALDQNQSLTAIGLNENKFNLEEIKVAMELNIENLQLEDIELSEEGVGVIVESLMGECKIRNLGLGSNSVRVSGGLELARALAVNSTLVGLDLRNCGIGESVIEIFKCLEGNHTLTSFDISFNNILPAICKQFVPFLSRNDTLRELSLQGNYVLGEGAKLIFHNLPSSLTSLNLNNCEITREGIVAFTEILPNNTSLKSIYLQNNRFFREECIQIIQALENNFTLSRIKMTSSLYKLLSAEDELLFMKSFSENYSLTSVDFCKFLVSTSKDEINAIKERNKLNAENIRFKTTKVAN